MKTIGQSALVAIQQAKDIVEANKAKGTTVTLPAREKPLTVPDFAKIETLIENSCTVKSIRKHGSLPKKDPDGFIYAWTFESTEIGLEIIAIEDIDPRLIDAVQRPASSQGVIYHFTRLAALKRNTKGDVGFQVTLEDLAYDLRGRSEWAIMKSCEYFRKQKSPFFPDHAEILEIVEKFHKAALTIKPIGGQIEQKSQ